VRCCRGPSGGGPGPRIHPPRAPVRSRRRRSGRTRRPRRPAWCSSSGGRRRPGEAGVALTSTSKPSISLRVAVMLGASGRGGDQTMGKVFKPATEAWPRAATLPTFVAARRLAGLAGRSPGPPSRTAPTRAGRYPAASLEVSGTLLPPCWWTGCPIGAPAAWSAPPRPRWRQPGAAAGELGALGFWQPDGTFITSIDDLRHWLADRRRRVAELWPLFDTLRLVTGASVLSSEPS
jgi:hypothetical protein